MYIKNGENLLCPSIVDGVKLNYDRVGVCGKFEFEVYLDDVLSVTHGDGVILKVDNVDVFYGFIFILKENPKKKTIKITAYDQLRYLKNKESYAYSNMSASDVVRMIANDFRLNLGIIDDTGYKISSRIEEDKTLFDIILSALDITLKNTGRLYVLYDDFGKLMLRDVENLLLDVLIDADTATSFDYKSLIDSGAYNKIKITKQNDDTGLQDTFIAKDSENMNKWGILQWVEKADDGINPANQANTLLSLYNRPKRDFTLKKVCGDLRFRPGFSVLMFLSLNDIRLKNYMMIEKATHTFKDDVHFVDVTLIGGDINVN